MHSLQSDLQSIPSAVFLFSLNKDRIYRELSPISIPHIAKEAHKSINKQIQVKSNFQFSPKTKGKKEKPKELSLVIENSNRNRIKSIFSNPHLMSIPKSTRFYQSIERNLYTRTYCRKLKGFSNDLAISHPQSKAKDKDTDSSRENNRQERPKESLKIFRAKPKPLKLTDKFYKELYKQRKGDYSSKMRKKYSSEGNTANSKGCQVVCFDNNQSHRQRNYLTCLLDKSEKGELPMPLPVFISLNSQYASMSEKRRHEKLMDKFIKLKTLIGKDSANALLYIREFLIKNNVTNSDYYSNDKLQNFNAFLCKKFNFDTKKTLNDIISEAINYKPVRIEDDDEKSEGFVINYHQYQQEDIKQYPPKASLRKSLSNANKRQCKSLSLDQDQFFNHVHRIHNKKDLKGLVSDLEKELNDIQNEHQIQAERLNEARKKPKISHQLSDKNKLVPNLCLESSDINKDRLAIEKVKDDKLFKSEQKLLDINHRLYYSPTNKANQIPIEQIKKRNKLTEFIILERSKKELNIEERRQQIQKENRRFLML